MSRNIDLYCRVSTQDQSLDRQKQSTTDYALHNFDVLRGDLTYHTDKSTGTDTDRSGYHDLLDRVETGKTDVVIVHSISRISRSIRDLDRTVERIVDENGCEFHIIKESFVFLPDEDDDPFQKAMFRQLGVFAQLEAELAQQRTREGIEARQNADEDYHHGRPPLGFENVDGLLHRTDNYDTIVTTLEMVLNDNLSKRKAAQELDTSRATINRALDRKEMYGL